MTSPLCFETLNYEPLHNPYIQPQSHLPATVSPDLMNSEYDVLYSRDDSASWMGVPRDAVTMLLADWFRFTAALFISIWTSWKVLSVLGYCKQTKSP